MVLHIVKTLHSENTRRKFLSTNQMALKLEKCFITCQTMGQDIEGGSRISFSYITSLHFYNTVDISSLNDTPVRCASFNSM